MSEMQESTLVFEPDEASSSRLEMKEKRTERTVVGNVISPRVFERVTRDVDRVFRPLPVQLIRRYARAAASHGVFDQLDGGRWYGEVRLLRGVWADGDTPDEVRDTLAEVAEEWALLRIDRGDRDIPVVDTIDLNVL